MIWLTKHNFSIKPIKAIFLIYKDCKNISSHFNCCLQYITLLFIICAWHLADKLEHLKKTCKIIQTNSSYDNVMNIEFLGWK